MKERSSSPLADDGTDEKLLNPPPLQPGVRVLAAVK